MGGRLGAVVEVATSAGQVLVHAAAGGSDSFGFDVDAAAVAVAAVGGPGSCPLRQCGAGRERVQTQCCPLQSRRPDESPCPAMGPMLFAHQLRSPIGISSVLHVFTAASLSRMCCNRR